MSASADEPPRKKLRKGTKSCWECKRRKIRCQPSSADTDICAGCLSRGTHCIGQDQDFPEDYDGQNSANMGQRLRRMESMLEELVGRQGGMGTGTPLFAQEDTPGSFEIEDRSQRIEDASGIGDASKQGHVPVMSLFSGDMMNSQEPTQENHSSRSQTSQGRATAKHNQILSPSMERLRRSLIQLLPKQEDVDTIYRHTNGWAVVTTLARPPDEIFQDEGCSWALNLAAATKQGPVFIARTLIIIATCVQQLPPEFDPSRFHFSKPLDILERKNISTVAALLTSDDSLIASIEGLECLCLEGMYYLNAGSLRRAWLTFRRALSINQALGFDRSFRKLQPGEPLQQLDAKRQMWYQAVMAERYTGFHLGMPTAAEVNCFGNDEACLKDTMWTQDLDFFFQRKFVIVMGQLLDLRRRAEQLDWSSTLHLDDLLEGLEKEMGTEFWEVPNLDGFERSKHMADMFDRVMQQMWYFQARSLLHVPYMFRALSDPKFGYSKVACLRAAREAVKRYLAMRAANNTQFTCRMQDYGAFTAATCLILALIKHPSSSVPPVLHERPDLQNDLRLVEDVTSAMEYLSRSPREILAKECHKALSVLLDLYFGRSETATKQLNIPYFGRVSVRRPAAPEPPPPPQQKTSPSAMPTPIVTPEHRPGPQNYHRPHPSPEQVPNRNVSMGQTSQPWLGDSFAAVPPIQSNVSAAGQNYPFVAFESDQMQLPHDGGMGFDGWDIPEADQLFFDSLMNEDLQMNWVFPMP